jgi:copper chaperone CopZ
MHTVRNSLFLMCLCLAIIYSAGVNAQFESSSIGVNGLTCSMCQKSVEKSLYRLKFIQSISSDLENTTLYVTFKPGTDVSIEQLAEKVKSAGFTVRNIDVVFHFNHYAAEDNSNFTYGNATYHFINVGNKTLDGEATIRFVGKDYMTKDEYKKFASSVTTPFNPFAPYYYVTIPQ